MIRTDSIRVSCCLLVALSTGRLCAQDYDAPQSASMKAPKRQTGTPLITCTATELARLRQAYAAKTAAIRAPVRAARARLKHPVRFPPRGGQHNQWYQCEPCQVGLETVDATHHRCPRCRKIYTGAPYDDVLFSHVHSRNFNRARDAAWAFALTGEARFATDAAEILLGYADRYRRYPYHTNSRAGTSKHAGGGHIKEQSLSEASMMIDAVFPAYDLIWPALTTPQRQHIAADLLRPMMENLGRSRRGKSNWQSFHNAGMFAGGALLGEASWMRRAVLDPRHGFLFQMRACVSNDGMWYENSWGYHFYTLRALASHAEAARRCGIDLWGHPSLRRMVALPADYVMPDGTLPRFGDDVQSRAPFNPSVFEAATAALGLELPTLVLGRRVNWQRILHGRQSAAEGPTHQLQSKLFRASGHAILSQTSPGGLAAVLTFGPFGGFHGHFDKLSFVSFGGAREFGVDPGRARSQAYRLPIHKLWYRGTLAHNTVVVDGQAQRGAAGQSLLFEQRAGYQAAAASCRTAYPGVTHRRCLLLTRDYLLVLDLIDADKQRRFDWCYHHRSSQLDSPQAPTAVDAESAAGLLAMSGSEFVKLQRTGRTRELLRASFSAPASAKLILAAAGNTEVFLGTGPGSSVLERVPMLIARRHGKRVAFAATIQARGKIGTELGTEIDTVRQLLTADGIEVLIQRHSGAVERFSWNGSNELRSSLR